MFPWLFTEKQKDLDMVVLSLAAHFLICFDFRPQDP